MNAVSWIILSVMFVAITGCSSSSYVNSPDYMKSAEYQKRDALNQSLFNAAAPLKEEEVRTILNSKLVLPAKSRIGIVKIEHKTDSSSAWGYYDNLKMSQQSFQLSEKTVERFFGEIKKCHRVKDIVLVPIMLAGNNNSLSVLREIAVRMQLDELLIVRSESRSDYQFKPFSKDLVTARTTVEAVLLDIRTGLIPFSSVSSGSEVVVETSDQRSRYEHIWLAAQESETVGLIEVGKKLVGFLNAI